MKHFTTGSVNLWPASVRPVDDILRRGDACASQEADIFNNGGIGKTDAPQEIKDRDPPF